MIRRILTTAVGLAVLGLLVAWGGGFLLRPSIEPGLVGAPPSHPEPDRTAVAARERLPVHYEAVGTVASRVRSEIASQVTARIVDLPFEAGQAVGKGQVLAHLDARELSARLDQASQAAAAADAERRAAEGTREAAQAQLSRASAARSHAAESTAAAQARFARAESAFERTQRIYERGAGTEEALENAQADFDTARSMLAAARQMEMAAEADVVRASAEVERAGRGVDAASARLEQARKVVEEAGVALEFARIESPIDGVLAERRADPGDLAWPGRVLFVVHDPARLRLEVSVSEGLVAAAAKGRRYEVVFAGLDRSILAEVEEVLPAADPRSRSFVVRVALPEVEGLYPGMYGRLRLPLGDREVVLVPARAVRQVGQLRTVLVRQDDRWVRRFVRTGDAVGDRLEIRSGLSGGETVGFDE